MKERTGAWNWSRYSTHMWDINYIWPGCNSIRYHTWQPRVYSLPRNGVTTGSSPVLVVKRMRKTVCGEVTTFCILNE
ncbi:hypothetical protein [Chryseobacterium sp. ISL-6]|uniref:hypothetical protein n=1 Tax=Chryseobacterium sp. ISL-6 TaxID=2819143 RepID=UPI001BE8D8D5|nr:hypothetical protein [Chryseobacterium sp. ISL-6]MBT2621910.1 hypothetical protein [Chryseobacterium sp. ISL-6]